MFAKVFNSAKRILSRSPSVQTPPSESYEATSATHDVDITMVSTRSGADLTPRETRKGKRGLEAGDTPVSSRKRRKSVDTEEKDKGAAKLDEKVDTAPIEQVNDTNDDTSAPATKEKLPIRRRTNPMVVINTPIARPSSAKATPLVSPKEQVGSPTSPSSKKRSKKQVSSPIEDLIVLSQESSKAPTTPKPKQKSKSDHATTSSISRFPEEIPSSTYESEQAVISSQEPAPVSSSKAKKAHIRFGSEEPAEAPIPIVIDNQEAPSMDDADDDSDSDEAPEEVTTASALRQAKAADEEALRAQKALQEKEKLKRRERADRIKQEQGIKQKKAEKKAAKLAKQRAREELMDPAHEELNVDIHNLPALLPESILEAAGDTRPPTPPARLQGRSVEEARQEKLNRHIKFLERGEKPVKDVKKGSLNVHVLGQQNMLLAPKVNRDTKNIREKWLKGRQAEKQLKGGRRQKMQFRKVERRAVGGGFLRGDD
ncbi:hypothetical protein K505DRAFT_279804 [Melanomma pulvis-pyrius CBS 109.77]|uniref:Uncharacterized protein n=1 Tax=Melanomma pulvis-pyrius CBS 109.77 TaxID=1314802 RepID=A0A6A6X6L1_9PLEO|nr:hypothetical protein K505DRAFT_279804 [Melanomma pulvis-pyrius CBS 109.77]